MVPNSIATNFIELPRCRLDLPKNVFILQMILYHNDNKNTLFVPNPKKQFFWDTLYIAEFFLSLAQLSPSLFIASMKHSGSIIMVFFVRDYYKLRVSIFEGPTTEKSLFLLLLPFDKLFSMSM